MHRLVPLLLCIGCLTPLVGQQPAVDGAAQLAEAQKRLKKVGAGEYELDGIRIQAATRELRLPARVELRQAPIEYLLVHETGKTHETVLTTAVSPTAIQVALLLAHHQAASEGLLAKVPAEERSPSWREEPPATPGGNRVEILVEWQEQGKQRRARLADWVQNADTRKPPPDLTHWIFNGSLIDERGFVAEHEGSIVAVWLDRAAILNSPAEGNWDDQRWISLPKNIPAEGTEVTVVIQPAKSAAPSGN
jgi:hypothetical protein